MRLAVISDVHGNCVALDAVIADMKLRGVDRAVCLGDVVQGGAQPALVLERMADLACPTIIGNADAFVLTGDADAQDVRAERRSVREWTVEQIGASGLDVLRTYVPTHLMPIGDKNLLGFHGTPESFDGVLLPETPKTEIQRLFDSTDADALCGGHTHLQWMCSVERQTFFNPGSVGLSYNRFQTQESFRFSPFAEYAVLSSEDGQLRIEFCSVNFDVAAAVKAYEESGHPAAERFIAQYAP